MVFICHFWQLIRSFNMCPPFSRTARYAVANFRTRISVRRSARVLQSSQLQPLTGAEFLGQWRWSPKIHSWVVLFYKGRRWKAWKYGNFHFENSLLGDDCKIFLIFAGRNFQLIQFEKCFWMGWETASYQRLINTARGVAIANCDTKPSSACGVFCCWSFERLMCWRPRFSPRITVTWQSRIPAAGGSWPEQRSEWYKFGRGIWCLQIRVTIAGCAPCTLYEIWIDCYHHSRMGRRFWSYFYLL